METKQIYNVNIDYKSTDPNDFIDALNKISPQIGGLTNLGVFADIKSITPTQYLVNTVENHFINIKLSAGEKPDKNLKNDGSSSHPFDFPFAELLSSPITAQNTSSEKKDVVQVSNNILLGTIEDHECDPKEDCHDCHGRGECTHCRGTGATDCHTCHGRGSCTKCQGQGSNTCRKCQGQGQTRCPECGGQGICRKCQGTGQIRCKYCGGNGFHNGVKCSNCSGNGFIACDKCSSMATRIFLSKSTSTGSGKCTKCEGTGVLTCSECKGSGEIICSECHGSGNCITCSGSGKLTCDNCQGDGKCPNCEGTGRVTCSRCEGSGWFQTYQSYICTEYRKKWTFISKGELSSIMSKTKGFLIYEDTYKVWASANSIKYDKTKEMESTFRSHLKEYSYLFDDYLSEYSNHTEIITPDTKEDRPCSLYLRGLVIPATK